MSVILLHAAGLVLVLVLSQGYQIFPGALFSLFTRKRRDPRTLPEGIESVFIRSDERTKIELWRLPPSPESTPRPFTALVFHGNAGMLDDFLLLQSWFSDLGIVSYSFDYRGFGKSTGYPTESGIYRDSDAVWQYVLDRERTSSEQVIVMGFSVGGAPAARIAAMRRCKLLFLLCSFTSIPAIAREYLLFRIFVPFLRYELPTERYVASLTETSLLLAHAEGDTIVPSAHSHALQRAYRGSGQVRLLLTGGDHNTMFYLSRARFEEALLEMLA